MDKILSLIERMGLTEATGGIARRWIEVQAGKNIPFINNKTKDTFTIDNLHILPADPLLRYEDNKTAAGVVPGPHSLAKDVQSIIDGIKPSPIEIKTFGPNNSRAAVVVIMKDSSDNTYVYVKRIKAKRSLGPNGVFWQTSDFAKETGLWAQTAQMKKAAIPIEPTDFVAIGEKYSVANLVKAVKSNVQKNDMLPEDLRRGIPGLLDNVLSGNTTPIPKLAEFQPAIEIKLSELVAPIALVTGNFMKGDYDKVQTGLLDQLGTKWSRATGISFPAKAEKLIDATVHFGNDKIDISVKDSTGGGRPSISTVVETITKNEFDTKFKRTYKDEIAALQILENESAILAPLHLAMNTYGVLTDKDAAYLRTIYGKGAADVRMIPSNWKKLMAAVPYAPDTEHPEYQLGYHLLAVVAKYVAIQLNEDAKKITDFFKAVLNKSNLVQVYAKTKTDPNGGLYYSQFTATWPPVFEGTIKVDADSYTARTRPSRKISFSFSSSHSKAAAGVTSAKIDKKIDAIGKGTNRVDIRQKGAATPEKRTSFTPGLGRERR